VGIEDEGDVDVVAIAAGDAARQRKTAGVADQVVFAAGASPVDRRGADVVPPLSARTCEPSIAQRFRSSSPRAMVIAVSVHHDAACRDAGPSSPNLRKVLDCSHGVVAG
jgi:hypothetical protein